jgi:hypothetical protein
MRAAGGADRDSLAHDLVRPRALACVAHGAPPRPPPARPAALHRRAQRQRRRDARTPVGSRRSPCALRRASRRRRHRSDRAARRAGDRRDPRAPGRASRCTRPPRRTSALRAARGAARGHDQRDAREARRCAAAWSVHSAAHGRPVLRGRVGPHPGHGAVGASIRSIQRACRRSRGRDSRRSVVRRHGPLAGRCRLRDLPRRDDGVRRRPRDRSRRDRCDPQHTHAVRRGLRALAVLGWTRRLALGASAGPRREPTRDGLEPPRDRAPHRCDAPPGVRSFLWGRSPTSRTRRASRAPAILATRRGTG